jgi:hypothetical protein
MCFESGGVIDRNFCGERGVPSKYHEAYFLLRISRFAHPGVRFHSATQPKGVQVARKTVVVSDLSGEQIADGRGAKVRITFDDARSGSIEMDVTADEARAMGAEGRQVARRGRKPKSS